MNADEMMTEMVNALESKSHEDLEAIAEESGVALSTLYYWRYGVIGVIEYPHLCNFIAVANVLGFKITMK